MFTMHEYYTLIGYTTIEYSIDYGIDYISIYIYYFIISTYSKQ